jgi:hypothetical protein
MSAMEAITTSAVLDLHVCFHSFIVDLILSFSYFLVQVFSEDFDVHHLTTESSVNAALVSIVDGVVGFDTEFRTRQYTPEEVIINEAIDLVGGSRKHALLAWHVLEERLSAPFPFAWDTMGLCVVQLACGRDAWVIDLRKIHGESKRDVCTN